MRKSLVRMTLAAAAVLTGVAAARPARAGDITTVIFDLGGVVVGDNDPSQAKFLAELLELDEAVIVAHYAEAFRPVTLGLRNEREALEDLVRAQGGRVPADFAARAEAQYLATTPIRPEVVQLVKCLRARGYRTPLLSDTIALHARVNAARGAFEPFSPLFLSHEMHRRKPDASTFAYVLAELGAEASQCVFVDDRMANVRGAEDVGIRGVQFVSAPQLRQDLIALGIDVSACETTK